MKTTIKEAPNYSITHEGTVLNEKTGKTVTEVKGSVRLQVEGNRKSFKVADLKASNPVEAPAKGKAWSRNGNTETPKASEEKVSETPKAKSKAKKTEKKDKKKAVKKIAGQYPYKIKGSKEIEAAKKLFKAGDKVTFIDYKTKKKVTGTFVSHTIFSDNYPAARVSSGKGKEKKSSLKSYLTIKKK